MHGASSRLTLFNGSPPDWDLTHTFFVMLPPSLLYLQVWVYDNTKFPFHLGEVYHQYHDGFMPGEDYPPAYNDLKADAYRAGRLVWSGCPDIVGP